MGVLALDVGNTRLKWAYYERAQPGAQAVAQGAEFLEQIDGLSEGPWQHISTPKHVIGCIVAGDAIKQRVHEQLELWESEATWVVPQAQQGGMCNGYEHPARLGPDRWVAMIGAHQYLLARKQRRPLVLVMVGTAVTVEAVDQDGSFLGGLILPGHGIMLKSLLYGTAGLHVPTGDVVPFPKNTSDALTSGGTYAIAGAVQRMTQHLERHCGLDPVCLMTGGAAWKMAPYMPHPVTVEESLIFDGLLHLCATAAR